MCGSTARWRMLVVLTLMLACALLLVLRHRKRSGRADQQQTEAVALTISSPRKRYWLGEPVRLKTVIQNNTRSAMSLEADSDLKAIVMVDLVGPGGDEFRFQMHPPLPDGPFIADSDFADDCSQELPPGGRIEYDASYAYHDIALPPHVFKPGTHHLRATCRVVTGVERDQHARLEVTSKTISIRINPPEREIDRKAFAAYTGMSIQDFLQHDVRGGPGAGSLDRCQQVLEMYPESLYAEYARDEVEGHRKSQDELRRYEEELEKDPRLQEMRRRAEEYHRKQAELFRRFQEMPPVEMQREFDRLKAEWNKPGFDRGGFVYVIVKLAGQDCPAEEGLSAPRLAIQFLGAVKAKKAIPDLIEKINDPPHAPEPCGFARRHWSRSASRQRTCV